MHEHTETTTMRAARWHAAHDVRVEDVPVPVPGPGEVLVRVDRAGICGTDLEEYLHGPVGVPVGEPHPLSGQRAPLILGHELVGTVVSAGAHEPPAGSRVVPDVVVGCGRCWWCVRHQEGLCPDLNVRGLQSDGGLAEYVVAEAATCVRVPDHVAVDAAAFAEPLSVAVRALQKAGDLTGAAVVVIGAGVIGQLVTQVALGAGAVAVLAVDPVQERRDLAGSYGAASCRPEDAAEVITQLTDGRGGDVVVECSGARGSVKTSLTLARDGGTSILVGFRDDDEPLPLLSFVLGERRLLGTAAHLWDTDVATAVALLSRGSVDTRQLLSGTIALRDVVTGGFERLRADKTAFKILVDPNNPT